MSKERKPAIIRKPVLDEDAVLRFVAAASPAEKQPAVKTDKGESSNGVVPLTISLKSDMYAALAKEAARKSRTVEEQVRKILSKHLS
jgi:hypothetical protein